MTIREWHIFLHHNGDHRAKTVGEFIKRIKYARPRIWDWSVAAENPENRYRQWDAVEPWRS